MKKYEWLVKRHLRSVDSLKLWAENPRLNPDGKYLNLLDYVEELLSDNSEKESFVKLLESISKKGFIPSDPIVVWRNEDNSHCYVVEGNRRVLALKLLRNPQKAPKSIRPLVKQLSSKTNLDDIQKINVCIAPSFDDTIWYINERHTPSALQKPWSRIQHQRWIFELYQKYNGDIDSILAETSADRVTIEADIRILRLIGLIKQPQIKNLLSEEEYEKAVSHRFPITILERFFNYSKVREAWFITFDGTNVVIKAEETSFFNAYAELIRRIITGDGKVKVNTRMTSSNVEEIINSLPTVIKSEDNLLPLQSGAIIAKNSERKIETNSTKVSQNSVLKRDVNRPKLILGIYTLESADKRLVDLFNELKKLSVSYYPTCVCACMRVFLDISVRLYIEEKGWEMEITKNRQNCFQEVTLHKRLAFIKDKLSKCEEKTIIERLLNPKNEFSLDVLNGYVHSSDTHYELRQFMNGFWDFMFPLFRMMLDIRESSTSIEKNTNPNL